MRKIDVHTHILPKVLPKFMNQFGYGGFVELIHDTEKKAEQGGSICSNACARMVKDDGTFFRKVEANCFDEVVRLKECDQLKVNVQVLSTVPVMFSYWAKAKDTLEVAKFLNDHLADVVSNHPKRFIALGTLPMQDPDLAILELHRSVKELKLKGVQIATHINGDNLNHAKFKPFFEEANKLKISLFIHPWEMMGENTMKEYFLPWLVGMPAETSRAICSMIFGGIFDQFPNIRTLFAHGGGSFPFTLGRISHGYHSRPDLTQKDGAKDPRTYLDKFFLDTLVHDESALKYLIDLFGVKQLALGSDYPFPLGEEKPGELINKMKELSVEDKKYLNYLSALRWLGISEEFFEKND